MAAIGYGDDVGLQAYADAIGYTILAANLDIINEGGYQVVESKGFKGTKTGGLDQVKQWPRTGVYIDGFLVPDDVIPDYLGGGSVVRMQYAAAIAIDQGNDPLAAIERAVKMEKVDVLEVEYMDNAASSTITPTINNEGYKLLAAGSGGTSFRVYNS